MSSQGENRQTLNTLYKLKKEILKSDNDTLVSQIDHAIQKTYNDQLVFSFIGHYSAGKSSLINYLLNQDILPSSPVPTTSNTVSVQIGNKSGIQAFINQYQYASVDNYEELKALNTKDMDIQAITMDIQSDDYQQNTVFQDTPGVDSNTDSHEEAANRFLLNSDLIFFTVEYNHVESEHNLTLLKEIAGLGIPLVLIINQIDKHDDQEITLDTFLNRVKTTLTNWNIHPEHLFTTSIYESPYNHIDDLKAFIKEMEKKRAELEAAYDTRITKNIEDKQLEYLRDELETLTDELQLDNPLTKERAAERIDYLNKEIKKAEIDHLRSDEDELRSHVKESVKKLVKDSYLFPHQVKDAITEYLKVMAGEKKAGGLFGKKKKEQALLENTLAQVDEAIQPVIHTEINANINSFFQSLGLIGEPFKFEWNHTMLGDEKITSLNQTYISNYFDKLKSSLTQEVSERSVSHLETLTPEETGEVKAQTTLTREKAFYIKAKDLLELIESLDTQNYRHFYIHLDDEIDKLNLLEEITLTYDEDKQTEAAESRHNEFIVNNEDRMNLQAFHELRDLLEDSPRYTDYQRLLNDKLSRIDNGKANISVFGGFSAGKTTFINALLGDKYLATSPNPTTATITEINNDDTSTVVYKSEADLTETLQTLSGEDHKTADGYKKWINKNISKVDETYKPLLSGILENYDKYKDDLGQTVSIDTDALIEKISNDKDSTFIHKANVSLENEMTEAYTLVDSPGINSINARHTSETRDIITESDMIIYVSYYNHVFSRSDETFLQYIQSLKGKDFPIIFIINAVDLMKSEADKEKVLDYMRNALNTMHIKHVLYPVSSKRALDGGDGYFNTAQKEIKEIADRQSGNVQYQTLKETRQQLLNTLESNIRQFEDNGEERSKLLDLRQNLLRDIGSIKADSLNETLKQEIDIILTYLTKRLELQLYDHLKGLLTVSHMSDRHYLTDNSSVLVRNIEDFLTLETSIAFNAVYRQADQKTLQMITQFNERLALSGTPGTLSITSVKIEEPHVRIDADVLKPFGKILYQHRNKTQDYRETLLELAETLVRSVDQNDLRAQMEKLAEEYTALLDRQLSADRREITAALKEEPEEISRTDYDRDRALLKAVQHISI